MDRDSRLHEGVRLHHPQINLERDQKASVLTDEESNMFEIKKGTKQGDPLSSVLFNMVLQKALWRTTFRAGKRKKEWEFTSVTTTMTASQTRDLPTTCSCLHRPKNSSKKYVVRIQEKYRKSETQDTSRKDENSWQPKLGHKKRN